MKTSISSEEQNLLLIDERTKLVTGQIICYQNKEKKKKEYAKTQNHETF